MSNAVLQLLCSSFFSYAEFLERVLHWGHSAYSGAVLINFFVPNVVLIQVNVVYAVTYHFQ